MVDNPFEIPQALRDMSEGASPGRNLTSEHTKP
jgi:hypothetical protein